MSMIAFAALLAVQAQAAVPAYRTTCEPAVLEAWSTSYGADASTQSSHDRSTHYCFHDGRGEIAEYRSLGPNGAVVFHGASITIWNDDRSRGRTLWVMVGVHGHTDIQLRWEDNRLVATGDGFDPDGVFKEKWTTEFLRGGDQHFEMSRSYDDGESWRSPFNVIEYLKTPATPPPLPSEWSDQFAEFAPALVGEDGMIFLDGNAWGAFQQDKAGAPTGFVFASVAPMNGAWVWRTVTWSFKKGVVSVRNSPLS
ncbi:hypothetical protein [Hyphococcus sp.]|uniref:hypothetical protein n=1 Tax=Hyphococcus sp. TaxID=2038636 RepID=UPI00208701A1|nr:MAG: hypothetical protein DHS20C04_28820 [Marinicaulis sp.]